MARLFLIFCCTFFACALFAQHIPIPFDSVNGSPYTKFKNELSFDIRGILYAAPTASVTYRMQLGEKRKSNLYHKKAFRVHANGYFGFPFNEVTGIERVPPNVTTNSFSSEPIDCRYADINLFAGIEKQHFLRRLVFYHGLEIGGGWSHFTSSYFSTNNYSADQTNELKVSETKIFLSCFAGLKYFLVPQISLSVECNAYGGINFLHQKFDYYEYDSFGTGNGVRTTTTHDERNSVLKVNRFRSLNIGYHF